MPHAVGHRKANVLGSDWLLHLEYKQVEEHIALDGELDAMVLERLEEELPYRGVVSNLQRLRRL